MSKQPATKLTKDKKGNDLIMLDIDLRDVGRVTTDASRADPNIPQPDRDLWSALKHKMSTHMARSMAILKTMSVQKHWSGWVKPGESADHIRMIGDVSAPCLLCLSLCF